jgi:hypothetical protein
MRMTRHGESRMQQRATPPLVASLILEHGCRIRSHGADLVFINKAARREISRALGGSRGMRLIEPFLNRYLIVADDDGSIITAACRKRRIHRP